MDERRQHRSPYVAEGLFLRTREGRPVAACETPQLAKFLAITANYFDRFSSALKVCKAERESENRELSPAQQDLDKLLNEYEADLRG